MQSPLLMTIILTGYLLMIKHGPKLMESRKAFELKFVLMVYNLAQVVLNLALGIYVLKYSHCKPASSGLNIQLSIFQGVYHQIFVQNYNFDCQPVDYSATKDGIIELKLVYSFFLLKVLDLLDTVS